MKLEDVQPMGRFLLMRKLIDPVQERLIHIPDYEAYTRFMQGEIVARGPKVRDPHLKVGAVVIHKELRASDLDLGDGFEYYLMDSEAVHAVNCIDTPENLWPTGGETDPTTGE